MVVFICGSCGSSLNKSKVENHLNFQCRSSHHVSCMDCGKDFTLASYKEHVKCVTEDQKYGGKGFVQKEFKGEKKQEEWISQLEEIVSKTTSTDPKLSSLLNLIIVNTNIPRKKKKFENFLSNSLNVRNTQLVEKAWAIFDSVKKQPDDSTLNGKPKKSEQELSSDEQSKITEDKEFVKPEKEIKKDKKNRSDIENVKVSSKEKRKLDDDQNTVESVDDLVKTEAVKKNKKHKKDKMADLEEVTGNADELLHDLVEPEVFQKRKKNKKDKKLNSGEEISMKTHNIENNLMEPKGFRKGEKPYLIIVDNKHGSVTKKREGGGVHYINVNNNLETKANMSHEEMINNYTVVCVNDSLSSMKKKHKCHQNDGDVNVYDLEKAKTFQDGERKKGEMSINAEESVHKQDDLLKLKDTSKVNTPNKFKWKSVIKSLLKNGPEEGLKCKKLKKKVLKEYKRFHGGSCQLPVSEVEALFESKLNNDNYAVFQGIVKLNK